MASSNGQLPDLPKGTGSGQSGFVDDDGYRRTVLQLKLEADQTEEDIEERLLDEARQLGAVTWDIDISFLRLLETDIATPPTSSAASLKPSSTAETSTANIAVSSSSTFASSRGKVPSSRHSIISSSTCPTFCSCNDPKPPTRSRSEKSRSRYSLDPSRLRSDSRDGRLRSGFKSALSRFPSFKKRSSIDFTTSPRASTCPERQSTILAVTQAVSCDTPVEEPDVQEWNNPRMSLIVTSPDEASLLRSLQSDELRNMRHRQDSQRGRHMVFKTEIVERMKATHGTILNRLADQNRKSEEEMSSRHAARATNIEENQLSAELTLVEDFKRQKQALQSQLRHMEAYFRTPTFNSRGHSGDSPKSEPGSPRREYTLEERDRLRQKYHEWNSIDRLHESKIKVLRERQTKRYEEAVGKMEREAIELAESNRQLYEDAEKRCRDEEATTLTWLETREKRLAMKWMLEEAILRKKLELETNEVYGPLPPLSFDEVQNSPTPDVGNASDASKPPNEHRLP